MPKMKQFYREAEVADILGISKRSLSRFRKDDLLTSHLKRKAGHINYELLKDNAIFQN